MKQTALLHDRKRITATKVPLSKMDWDNIKQVKQVQSGEGRRNSLVWKGEGGNQKG